MIRVWTSTRWTRCWRSCDVEERHSPAIIFFMRTQCHPSRKHAAHGLCFACYRRKRYAEDPEYRAARIDSASKYYRKNAGRVAARVRAGYAKSGGRTQVFARRIRHRWGMSLKDYRTLLKAQDGRCAICRRMPERARRLAIDHCHKTDKIRGLLCRLCNLVLGNAKDSAKILASAITYLEKCS